MEYDEYGDRVDGFGIDEESRPLTREELKSRTLSRLQRKLQAAGGGGLGAGGTGDGLLGSSGQASGLGGSAGIGGGAAALNQGGKKKGGTKK